MQQPVERAMATGGDSGGNSIRNGTCMAMVKWSFTETLAMPTSAQ